MKNSTTYAKKLSALLRRLRKAHKLTEQPESTEPVTQLVLGFLQWNATRKQARTAYERITAQLVDHNDLRVSHSHEIIALLGSNYPRAEERAARMRDALQEIFVREHVVSLSHLHGKGKKEVRAYLDTLPGIPPYVAAQVLLLSFGGHAIPVDDHLADVLRGDGIVDPDATVEVIESFLEHQVRAGEGVAVHHALQTWADTRKPRKPRPAAAAKRSTTARKSTRSSKPARKVSKKK